MNKIKWWFRRGWQLYVVWLQKRKIERDLRRVLQSTNGLLDAKRLLDRKSGLQARMLACAARGDTNQQHYCMGQLDLLEELLNVQK